MKIGFDVKKAFFDRESVMRKLDAASRNALSKAGAFVRQRARTSIRPGGKGRALRLDEMSRTEREDYFRRRYLWLQAGANPRYRPLRPRKGGQKTSRPGEPPRSHNGLLRRGIVFAYDAAERDVFVGPVRTNSPRERGIPGVLERGGRSRYLGKTIAARPFMRPALEKEAPNFARLWRGALR